jgi:LPS-assembly lipoprotein
MKRRAFLLAVPWFALAGCGFRLRGVNAMPFTSAWVEAGEGSLLGQQLREQLHDQRKLHAGSKGAPLVIRLSQEKLDKQILSLSGAGRVREYRLSYEVRLDVRDAYGKVLLEAIPLFAQRDFTYDDSQTLAKEMEEANLRRDMALELARQALTRIAYGRL